MRKYIEPTLESRIFEAENILTASGGGSGTNSEADEAAATGMAEAMKAARTNNIAVMNWK